MAQLIVTTLNLEIDPAEIEKLLGRHVFLELQVKVRPKWRRDAAMLERLGL